VLRMLRTLAGGELFGEVWGAAPPTVVALHGWRRTHGDFSAVLGPAAPGGELPTLAPDLPGFGATPAPPEAWGSAEYAEAVARLIRSEDGPLRPAVVVGHSLGGRVAVTLAARHPELVGALVLTGAPLVARSGPRKRPPAAFRAARALHRMGLLGETRMERARRRHGSADYRAAVGVVREVLVRLVNETYVDSLSRIRCPVELVWGTEDTEVPFSVAEELCSLLPQATLTRCGGAGHLVPLERPEELRAAVERSLTVT
jgi:pimeloyl-ACP methyl ester carboxylesterase